MIKIFYNLISHPEFNPKPHWVSRDAPGWSAEDSTPKPHHLHGNLLRSAARAWLEGCCEWADITAPESLLPGREGRRRRGEAAGALCLTPKCSCAQFFTFLSVCLSVRHQSGAKHVPSCWKDGKEERKLEASLAADVDTDCGRSRLCLEMRKEK